LGRLDPPLTGRLDWALTWRLDGGARWRLDSPRTRWFPSGLIQNGCHVKPPRF